MLKGLVGSKSVERVLFFLLVNEECYAHQLHHILNLAITPIQKALIRLEKEGILLSKNQGKTRVYRLNPQYPLINELEMLLRQGYHHLSAAEKKQYYYVRYEKKKAANTLLRDIWRQMKNVSQMSLFAESKKSRKQLVSHKGKGTVSVAVHGESLIFQEQGQWQDSEGKYSNSFRWTWNRIDGMLSLEHLRFGENRPVFLFHLVPTNENKLKSLHPHLCGDDTYFGWLDYREFFLHLHIRTIGPKKNEQIEYIYT